MSTISLEVLIVPRYAGTVNRPRFHDCIRAGTATTAKAVGWP